LLLGRGSAESEAPAPAAPPPELAQLDFLLGDWTGAGTLTHGTRDEKFNATLTVRRAVGGFFVIAEETLTNRPSHGAAPAVLQSAVLLMSYDAVAKQIRVDFYADGQPVRTGTGRLQGGVFALQFPAGPEKSPASDLRTFSSVGRRELKTLGEHSEDGRNWGIVLNATYARSAAL